MEAKSKLVVHVVPYYWPHGGGVERHLEKLAYKLRLKGYQQQIITWQHQPGLKRAEVHQQIPVHRLPYADPVHKFQHKFQVWRGVWRLRHLLFQADVIQVHDVFWWLLPLLPFLNSNKIFMTFHGYEGSAAPGWRQILWHRLAAWWTAGNLCIGDFHRKWYGVQPTLVSYGAAEPPKVKNQKQDGKKLIFIGRLADDNGIWTYIKAMKELPAFHFDVFGEGPLEAELQQYVKAHQLPVSFHGFVPNAAERLPEYQAAFISRYLGIIEALQAGIPVIAHYNNAIKYDYLALAPYASWIELVHEPAEVVAAVTQARSLPKTALTWAQAQTWSTMADTYQQLWQSIIKKN